MWPLDGKVVRRDDVLCLVSAGASAAHCGRLQATGTGDRGEN